MLWHACGPKLSGSNAVCTAVHTGHAAWSTGHGHGTRSSSFACVRLRAAGFGLGLGWLLLQHQRRSVAQFAFVSPSGRSSVGPVRAARAEPAAIHSWKFQFQKRRQAKDKSEALPQHPCQQAEAFWPLGTWREYLANNSMPTAVRYPLPAAHFPLSDSMEQNVLLSHWHRFERNHKGQRVWLASSIIYL